MGIKKGDSVLVLSGNDRGKRGEVLRVSPERALAVVQGVNLRWRHKKPNQQNPKGERVQFEAPVHLSNLRRDEAAKAAKPAKKTKSTKSTKAK